MQKPKRKKQKNPFFKKKQTLSVHLPAAATPLPFIPTGHYVRDICIYGLGDLQWIIESPHLFANKFEAGQDPLALQCLERRLRLKVLRQAQVPLEQHWHLQQRSHFDMQLHL